MIAYVLVGLAVLVGIYFYFQKTEKIQEKDEYPSKSNFYASDKFNGAMDGYVFKMGENGLGYYLDDFWFHE